MCVIERAVALNSYLLCCGLTCVCVCVCTRVRARICMLLCLSTCNKLQCHSKFRPILRTNPSTTPRPSSRPTSELRHVLPEICLRLNCTTLDVIFQIKNYVTVKYYRFPNNGLHPAPLLIVFGLRIFQSTWKIILDFEFVPFKDSYGPLIDFHWLI